MKPKMRKTTQIILLLIIGSISVTQAQTLIPKAGLTLATMSTEDAPEGSEYNNTSKTGFTIGIGYSFPVATLGSVVFSLQPEVGYVQKGFKGKSSGEFQIGEQIFQFKGDNEHTLNYLEFPVLAKFEYGSDKFKVGLYTGPSIGFALGGKYKTKSTVDTGETIEVYESEGKIVFYEADEPDVVSFDHNVDFGIQGGAVFTVFNRVSLDVRYGQSLTDIYHDAKSKNQVLQFTVGVPISL
jgi:hypothetical protein